MSRFGDLFDELILLGEHSRVEAKRSTRVGRSLAETISAFSNEPGLDGGYLLLGVAVEERDGIPSYSIVGVPDADRLQQEISSCAATEFNIALRPEIWVEQYQGKTVVGVYVPELSASLKPAFIRADGLPRGAFRRIGSTDQRCTDDDLLVFFEGREGRTYDETPIPGAKMEELDSDALAEYRRLRERVNPNAEELQWDDEDLLLSLGCLARVNGRLVPTVAGALLFGSGPLIRREFPMMRVDYIRIPGKEWVADPERRFESVDMRGPLIRLVTRAHAAVIDDIPTAFSLPAGTLQRNDVPLLPDRVVREAIVNAVMHRSYRVHGAIQVLRYANRLEISNPGHSLVSDDRLGEPGSRTRNPRIAAVFHDINFAETKGSGIRVMGELMRAADLAPPTFESDREGDRFIATFLFHHFLSDGDLEWIHSLGIPNLSSEDARALIYAREVGGIWNGAYRFINSVDTLTASVWLPRYGGHVSSANSRGR